MNKMLKRFKDLNKWSYLMNIAFGVALLMETLYFQFGETVLNVDNIQYTLDSGYITESHLWVRIIEGILSFGLIGLGIERLIKRRSKMNKETNLPFTKDGKLKVAIMSQNKNIMQIKKYEVTVEYNSFTIENKYRFIAPNFLEGEDKNLLYYEGYLLYKISEPIAIERI